MLGMIRAVLADDHGLFLQGLRELLTEGGIEIVAEASDGNAAIRRIEETVPDVAVLDLNMPGKTGIEVTRAAQEISPATNVLILTVSPQDEDVAEAIMAGARGYILKDSAVEEILAGVRAAARGESILSPSIASRLLERIRGNPESAREARPNLTPREHEVLRLIANGRDNGDIAAELFISQQTVKNHVANLLEKLQVENRIQAAVYAVRRGLD